MAANNSIVADAVLEDKLADLWPDYPCLYDVRCPEFKNRELRDKAFQELAEKLGTTCKIILSFQYRIGERTTSGIVEETCQALHEVMKDKYLKV